MFVISLSYKSMLYRSLYCNLIKETVLNAKKESPETINEIQKKSLSDSKDNNENKTKKNPIEKSKLN